MPATMMNIPKTLKVGYQERGGTYTGKLAYVIYYDEKGVLRKEAGWENWRDKKIEPNEYPNIPTSGFVLNKKVGDTRSGWNHRMAHIRVYDPRGFEFEITVENMLYILEECTSTKGKGLEGDFVYAWSGTDLVLLPTSSQEYVSSKKFTEMKVMKVGKKDMKEGCVYTTKDMQNVLYLGQHEIFEYVHDYGVGNKYQKSIGKKHVFKYMNKKETKISEYWFQDGFTKLASKVSDEIAPTFAEDYETFKKSVSGNKCNKVVVSADPVTAEMLLVDNFWRLERIVKNYKELIKVTINVDYTWDYATKIRTIKGYVVKEEYDVKIPQEGIATLTSRYGHKGYNPKTYTLEEIIASEWYKVELVNDHNQTIPI